jgi:hypothetical protein
MDGKIYKAMIAVMQETDAIAKGQTNKTQGFKYRGIDDIYNALHGLMSKHGIFCTSEAIDHKREERTTAKGTVLIYSTVTMKYKYYTDDGSFVESSVIGEGMDSGDKATNKAMAVAHKYSLIQTFMIPTEDLKDPDMESHEVKPQNDHNVKSKKPVFTDQEKAMAVSVKEYFTAINNGDFESSQKMLYEASGHKVKAWTYITPEIAAKIYKENESDILKFEETTKNETN